MKKAEQMRAEYHREEIGKGVRGKHYAEFRKGNNLVLLKPELEKYFPLMRQSMRRWIRWLGLRDLLRVRQGVLGVRARRHRARHSSVG
jgi:hypothetical protein